MPPKIVEKTIRSLRDQKHIDRIRYLMTFMGHDLPSWPRALSADELASRRRVLVLAPHPDDEAFGVGGAAALCKDRGVELVFRWLTCGENQVRIGESMAFLAELGVPQEVRASFPLPGEAISVAEASAQLDRELGAVAPDLIAVPSHFDPHPDHVRLCIALKKVIAARGWKGEVLQYEVWNTLVPNVLVDISSVAERKRRLMEVYHSQLTGRAFRYADRIAALNAYRGLPHEWDAAEGFILTSAELFLRVTTNLDARL